MTSRGFLAVDVETANTDRSSICSIAVVEWHNGLMTTKLDTLVDPQDVFSSLHVDFHGIHEDEVRDAPTWDRLSEALHGLLSDRVVVSHTLFDRQALQQASARWQVDVPRCTWLDSLAVARSAWPGLANHKLPTVCESLSYPLQYRHNALEDATAAGQVFLAATNELGFDGDRLLDALAVAGNAVSVTHRAAAASTARQRDGIPDAPLVGEVVVFAGELSLGPLVTCDLAAASGCSVAVDVSRRTTMLVEGRPKGHGKTRKQRRAAELSVAVLAETDFMDLLGLLR